MFTKTQIKVLEIFVSKIDEKFSIKQISELLNKAYPLIHRSVKSLIETNFINKDSKDLLSLNYKDNHLEIAYIESIRRNKFITKDKTIQLFFHDVLQSIKLDFFILLVFGSSISNKSPKDVDILLILDDNKKINQISQLLDNIASNFSKRFDINVISLESVYEMFSKRDENNIMNETLNNHIIIFGGENYYRVLKNAR
ncbi:MAG: hypothetical protein AABX29_05160 [Nanoarchaeota archaeon]